jgi:hypothetical protein
MDSPLAAITTSFQTVALTCEDVPKTVGQRSRQQKRDPKMGHQASFHAPHGGADFLGWRKRAGETEIVYDDGVTRRMIWRVAGDTPSEARISDALRVAVGAHRIIPTLYDELKKRAIAIEKIAG